MHDQNEIKHVNEVCYNCLDKETYLANDRVITLSALTVQATLYKHFITQCLVVLYYPIDG